MGTEIRTARVENATREHAPALLAYFARRVDQPHDAADLLAETLLVLWRRASALPVEDTEVRPWMFGIGRNVLMHYRRRALRQRAISDKLRSILSATPRPGFSDTAEHDALHRAIASLDAVDQDIIGLVHWDGFSLVEVSRIMKMKEGTVRSRYHRARTVLRIQIEQHLTHR
ncbi:ECF RNA polymerase sigma factor SigL [Arthrobacter ulcerisalmonis]|uniref:ECF RNA polymerase sigma factor SigL n=1 Tax=Arthrobacter ulcerisalmonis TaxID=2483813 RepID=A0A3P5X110_9MICC|nr:sigma-70 family RNA polymerase sigma factor [Arthrobacter ulcerisalmonis]VDC27758.1 ECF RNA polymerase sigma factor SigL [Arthrobacter ulcerisalmonis]